MWLLNFLNRLWKFHWVNAYGGRGTFLIWCYNVGHPETVLTSEMQYMFSY